MNRIEYMRKWICLAGLCLLFSSCFPSDPETTTPQYYSFVTTSITQEEGSSKSVVTFLTDTDKMLSVSNDEGLYKKVAATYSPTWWGSTIGDGELNFSVRNGKRWILTAITATICF